MILGPSGAWSLRQSTQQSSILKIVGFMYSHRFEVSIEDKPCGSCLLSKCEVVVDCLRGKVDNDRIRPPNQVYIHWIMDIIWKLSSQLEKRSFIYIRNCPHNDSWHSGWGSPYESKPKTLHTWIQFLRGNIFSRHFKHQKLLHCTDLKASAVRNIIYISLPPFFLLLASG